MSRGVDWVGAPNRMGAVQRLGILAYMLSIAIVTLSFDAPGSASLRYWMFVAAHTLLWAGFVIAAVADKVAHRPFSYGRLAYAAGVGILYVVLGPVVMAAAAPGST